MRIRKGTLLRTSLVVLGLAMSLLFIGYARWVYQIIETDKFLQEGGPVQEAESRYARAALVIPQRLGGLPGILQPLRQAALKRVQILYLEQRFEDGLEILQDLVHQHPFLESEADYHQWYGNLLFRHTLLQEDPEALLSGFFAAAGEYRKALELNPSLWDARYNYEMLMRVLSAEEAEGQQRLELLLEEIREDTRRRDQELAPEKRS